MVAVTTPRSKQGFSLIEVMIALAILGTGLLTLAAMQLEAITQGAAGRHTGDASAAARSHLEQVHRLPWAVLTTAAAAGDWIDPSWNGALATVFTQVDSPAGVAIENSYDVDWRVTDIGAAPVCLRDVEVRVSWTEDNRPTPKRLTLSTRRYNWGDPNC